MGEGSYNRNIAMVSGNVAKQFGIKRVPDILNAVLAYFTSVPRVSYTFGTHIWNIIII